jgi:hypothetical protein
VIRNPFEVGVAAMLEVVVAVTVGETVALGTTVAWGVLVP